MNTSDNKGFDFRWLGTVLAVSVTAAGLGFALGLWLGS
jgi:hypothetical protein